VVILIEIKEDFGKQAGVKLWLLELHLDKINWQFRGISNREK